MNFRFRKIKDKANFIPIILLLLGVFILAAVGRFSALARDTDTEQLISNLEAINRITSEAYAIRAEQVRELRANCAIAEIGNAELDKMQQANSARRKQISLLRTISGKPSL